MTPEELAQFQQRPRRRGIDIYQMTRDHNFIDGKNPFESDPFSSENQPFIGRKNFINRRNPFGL